ncbi:hypothetical protein [Streptomyces sp. HUAS TT20]|uniref:hypothetical protein n=1 Tax=Streptomyces sp. HUAS TT20 TaxID=3447509 RepID=UPI0021D9DB9E|nr:hypothetical protein [Streptomyces sp. HUAS 15-9]UXY32358.1 hypothetical protein N8I87_41610 [Streptomyces sp. HUAS 15-9]
MSATTPAPQPRYLPTRAGIINLWDYRDEEFSFAGGWLVLRGPNGSGKTKALEVLFPFVLDGRIDRKRLNPFAAEDRTMKSNLLFRGQEAALGYVWIEFTHRATGQAVTCGIGLHAQRHRDTPARWHFVVEGRVGEDFSLLTADDRPLTRKQLAAELAELGGEPITSATDHRAAVDQRLFGLGRERYEQLLTLILTLRRPQLAKNLDPAKLSDTLTEGLRPLDEDLIAEAARSFDDMESFQRTLEGLVAADEATRSFLAAYSTYLRVNVRVAADRLSARRAETAERERAHAATAVELETARTTRADADNRAEQAEAALAALRAVLEQLRTSAAYQAVEQLADLERLVRTCEQTARQATAERERRTAATGRARAEAEHSAHLAAELDTAVSAAAAALADHAHRAGIAWSAADAPPTPSPTAPRRAPRPARRAFARCARPSSGCATPSRPAARPAPDSTAPRRRPRRPRPPNARRTPRSPPPTSGRGWSWSSGRSGTTPCCPKGPRAGWRPPWTWPPKRPTPRPMGNAAAPRPRTSPCRASSPMPPLPRCRSCATASPGCASGAPGFRPAGPGPRPSAS